MKWTKYANRHKLQMFFSLPEKEHGKKYNAVPGSLLALVMLIVLTACQKKELRPVALNPEDVCAHCKMAVSEKKYAAEILTTDADAFKFDDLTCMTQYLAEKKNRAQIAAFFVVDLQTQEWVRGETAHFVSSPKYRTPMSGGIVAFREKGSAAAAASANGGKLLTFDELIRPEKTGE